MKIIMYSISYMIFLLSVSELHGQLRFRRGPGGGCDSEISQGSNTQLYKGSASSQSTSQLSLGQNDQLYIGGQDDGYNSTILHPANTTLYKGGQDDGYAKFDEIVPFIWTGTIGQGWNVPENWNYTVIPDINRPTIIPADVPNFPFINAGIFAIGRNPNDNGTYLAKSVEVDFGASLTTRVNAVVENYGYIWIGGTFNVINPSSGAFTNFLGAKIKVRTNGQWLFQN